MQQTQPNRGKASGEEGFLLLAMVFAVAVILIFLAVAAPSVAKDLQREREIEMKHRGDQYVRAIRLYYNKNKHYPGSIDELVKSNNIRWLRQKYVDPMTGKDDWRIIHVGENKTTVTGFFGEPLAGLNTAGGLGSAQGMLSGGPTGTTTNSPTTGGSNSSGAGNTGCGTGTANAAFGNSTFGSSDCPTTSTGTGTGSGTGTGPTSTDATAFGGSGGGPIMGVSSLSPKTSIIEIRKQTTYDTWEFIYDPRIEALYAKANILGGGVGSSSATGLGNSINGSGSSNNNSNSPFSNSNTNSNSPFNNSPSFGGSGSGNIGAPTGTPQSPGRSGP